MEEDLIKFDTAKLAKEKGYMNGGYTSYTQYHTDYVYDDDPEHPESHKKDEIRFHDRFFHINDFEKNDLSNEFFTIYEAPTQSLLQKWLRKKYNIEIHIDSITQTNYKNRTIKKAFYQYMVKSSSNYHFITLNNKNFKEYEDALEEALQESLKSITK